MGYAGTPLNRAEWSQAITDSARQALDEAMHSDRHGGPEVDIDEIVQHLVSLVNAGHRPYAWWAAHHYAEILGRRGKDIPERLTAAINQQQENEACAN